MSTNNYCSSINKDIEDIKQMLSPTNQFKLDKILNKLKDIDNEFRDINDKLDDMNETLLIMKYKLNIATDNSIIKTTTLLSIIILTTILSVRYCNR
jgi:chromosome segregation ATPase